MPLPTFFKECSTSFLMVCRLIDFALVVLKLLMFKVCVIIGISKIKFFNFSSSKPLKLVSQSLFKQFQQISTISKIPPQILEVYIILLVQTTLESIMFYYTFLVINGMFDPSTPPLYASSNSNIKIV